MPTIAIYDDAMQSVQPAWRLNIQAEVSSLREIIRSRIYQEVSEYNARKRSELIGLIQSEPQISAPMTIDWEEPYKQAIQGFSQQRYIVQIDQHQIVELDKPIMLTEATEVHFFQLVPMWHPKLCSLISLRNYFS
jgi:hypothetical protein